MALITVMAIGFYLIYQKDLPKEKARTGSDPRKGKGY
jgi:hypothetical protein